MKHPAGCSHQGCWTDRAGMTYHPGSSYGLYIVPRGATEALFLSGEEIEIMAKENEPLSRPLLDESSSLSPVPKKIPSLILELPSVRLLDLGD